MQKVVPDTPKVVIESFLNVASSVNDAVNSLT